MTLTPGSNSGGLTDMAVNFSVLGINKRTVLHALEGFVFTTRRYASAVLSLCVRPSVRLSVRQSVRYKSQCDEDG